MMPGLIGTAVVALGFGLWMILTPVVLWLRSRATVEPVVLSVTVAGVMVAEMRLSLVTLEIEPELSTTA